MRIRRVWLAVAGLLCVADPPARAALTPNAEFYLDHGLQSLYGLEYPQALSSFRRLIEIEPDNPFGYLFEAGAIWWQSSQEYGLFKDTPTLQGLFEQDIEAAIRKAEPLADSKDRAVKADAHFVLGMALGTRGQWGLMRGHWVKAYFDGRRALKHLKKCLKNDKDYHDAYLGLGVYDYQASRFGGLLRLSAVVGVRGDEERGLERLHLAVEKGRYGSRQAAQFLASIYIVDKRDYEKALLVVEKLRRDFPESVYFQFLESLVLFRLGRREASLQRGRDIFERTKADPANFNRKLLSLACGLTGEKCLDRQDMERAHEWFTLAIQSATLASPASGQALANPRGLPGAQALPPKVPAGAHPRSPTGTPRPAVPRGSLNSDPWSSLLRLYRGHASDILGRGAEAAEDYRWVLAQPDFSDNHARARGCLEERCTAPTILRDLRTLSRGEPWTPKHFHP